MQSLIRPFFLFLLIILFFNSSCSKEDDYPEKNVCPQGMNGNYPMYADLLNCRYKTGTYWVFIDSITGMTDSMYIDNFNQGYLNDNCNNSFQYHFFTATSYPSAISINYQLEVGYFYRGSTGLHTGRPIYTSYDALPNNPYYHFERYDSLFFYSQYYHDVVKTMILIDSDEGYNTTVYYMNSDFGFLRKDVIDSSSTIISKKILRQKNIVR